ncbi:MAG: TIR domain-containing protein, partial [Sphingobacteriales bacterium]
MPDKINVFVSYARKDEALATAMVEYFEKKDIDCFIDKRNIPVGSKYSEEIIKGIEQCDVVVLILTNKSNTSENVGNEIDNASNLKKKIIVFRIENIALSKGLQFYLSTSQWFDAFLYRGEQYFEQLADLVKGLPISPFSAKVIKQRKTTLYMLQAYAIISVILFLIFGIQILRDYAVVDTTNSRGIRFVDAIKMSGLTDIESGGWDNVAPPINLYTNAKREIFISGITLGYTLDKHRSHLREALARGVKIRLLLLHPQSPDSLATWGFFNQIFERKEYMEAYVAEEVAEE